MSLIQSQLAFDLVVREYRPANEWSAAEVSNALDECILMQDLHGAEGIFARVKQEFQVLYEHKFGTSAKEPTDSAVAINCSKALAAIEAIKKLRSN